MNKPDILLVEDNPADAELTIRALKKNNITHHLLHVTDGEKALDYLFQESSERSLPRLVILDLKMHAVNGLDVLTEMKKNSSTRSIPVVILTSSKEPSDLEKCYDLGVNSYIVKPVEYDLYMKVVSDLGVYWLSHNQTRI